MYKHLKYIIKMLERILDELEIQTDERIYVIVNSRDEQILEGTKAHCEKLHNLLNKDKYEVRLKH